ncbi:MAG: ribose-5-phosphate isomerase RpiA [Smithellaceae bacterium]|nr:ribose-5-phosphate isomerase RpiA [Smithellaceae bacterium]
MSTQDTLKRQAAHHAAGFVESGMVLGLGHGSTAFFALQRIAALIRSGKLRNVVGIPCSREVARSAREMGIPLTSLNSHPRIDLTIDGADEVDPALNLIKGRGGAMMREKIVAAASVREVIVVDEGKLSPVLGMSAPVPCEVAPFGWETQFSFLEELGAKPTARRNDAGRLFKTDQGNLILDAKFETISHPATLARRLEKRAGIVAHGLFIGMATEVIVAGAKGLRCLKRK